MIVSRHDGFILLSADGKKVLGTHATYEKALAQERAIQVSKQHNKQASAGWTGVDLDGTLARYTSWQGINHIGDPIPKMQARVKRWLAQGKDVRIFTARASNGKPAIEVVKAWCKEHLGKRLPVTNVKTPDMSRLWDDRAVSVEKNTGEKKASAPEHILHAIRNGDLAMLRRAGSASTPAKRMAAQANAYFRTARSRELAEHMQHPDTKHVMSWLDEAKEAAVIPADDFAKMLHRTTVFMDGTRNMRPMMSFKVPGGTGPIMFYRSLKGTSGKQKGAWFPFFGYSAKHNWLIKGTLEELNNYHGNMTLRDIAETLNSKYGPTFTQEEVAQYMRTHSAFRPDHMRLLRSVYGGNLPGMDQADAHIQAILARIPKRVVWGKQAPAIPKPLAIPRAATPPKPLSRPQVAVPPLFRSPPTPPSPPPPIAGEPSTLPSAVKHLLAGLLGFGAGTATGMAIDKQAASEAQIRAGNYKKTHLRWQGLDVSLENLKGTVRSGKDRQGRPWSVTMPAHYGYVKGTIGHDGDHVDLYLGPRPSSYLVYVINQRHLHNHRFDEHKCMAGFRTKAEAIATYDKGYHDHKGPERRIGVKTMTLPQFKAWLKDKKATQKKASVEHEFLAILQKRAASDPFSQAMQRYDNLYRQTYGATAPVPAAAPTRALALRPTRAVMAPAPRNVPSLRLPSALATRTPTDLTRQGRAIDALARHSSSMRSTGTVTDALTRLPQNPVARQLPQGWGSRLKGLGQTFRNITRPTAGVGRMLPAASTAATSASTAAAPAANAATGLGKATSFAQRAGRFVGQHPKLIQGTGNTLGTIGGVLAAVDSLGAARDIDRRGLYEHSINAGKGITSQLEQGNTGAAMWDAIGNPLTNIGAGLAPGPRVGTLMAFNGARQLGTNMSGAWAQAQRMRGQAEIADVESANRAAVAIPKMTRAITADPSAYYAKTRYAQRWAGMTPAQQERAKTIAAQRGKLNRAPTTPALAALIKAQRAAGIQTPAAASQMTATSATPSTVPQAPAAPAPVAPVTQMPDAAYNQLVAQNSGNTQAADQWMAQHRVERVPAGSPSQPTQTMTPQMYAYLQQGRRGGTAPAGQRPVTVAPGALNNLKATAPSSYMIGGALYGQRPPAPAPVAATASAPATPVSAPTAAPAPRMTAYNPSVDPRMRANAEAVPMQDVRNVQSQLRTAVQTARPQPTPPVTSALLEQKPLARNFPSPYQGGFGTNRNAPSLTQPAAPAQPAKPAVAAKPAAPAAPAKPAGGNVLGGASSFSGTKPIKPITGAARS